MSVELNHTIVRARDKHTSAKFLADILGVEVSPAAGHFVPVQLSNSVTLDYDNADEPIPTQHYAFLVDDDTFDSAFARIKADGVEYFADPGHSQPGEINRRGGGRGLYFPDPNGHNLELMTRA